MRNRAVWFGLGCLLLGCGESNGPAVGSGGAGNTAGASSSGGSGNAGGPAAGAGGGGAGGAPSAGSAGSMAGTAGAAVAGAAGLGGSSSAGGGGATAGGGGATAGGGASGAAGAPGTLSDVQAIFDDRCVLCHDATKVGLPSYPQLSLTAGNARASLVNKQGLEVCGGTLVVPGNPDQSYLVHKLSDATPCEGSRMPRPYEIGTVPPLTEAQMTTIRSWISAGAKP